MLMAWLGGWYNSQLTEKGIANAKRIGEFFWNLKLQGTTVIYCSDLKRAQKTGKLVASRLEHALISDRRLREMSFGENEGICQNEHDRIMVPCAPDESARMDHAICLGAESRMQFAARLSDFVAELDPTIDNSIIVTHGFAATFLIAALQRIPTDHMGFISYKMSSGAVTELVEDDLFRNVTLTRLNIIV